MLGDIRKNLLDAALNKVTKDVTLNPDSPLSEISFSNADFKVKNNGDIEITLSLKATANIYELLKCFEENKGKL